mmetsp:Transcript_20984/g.53151  ORF Transcript_20984/g.53151 Transcript_20984/m.53151 type:complete len:204 (+) Transcript_20984:2461-3072(+)
MQRGGRPRLDRLPALHRRAVLPTEPRARAACARGARAGRRRRRGECPFLRETGLCAAVIVVVGVGVEYLRPPAHQGGVRVRDVGHVEDELHRDGKQIRELQRWREHHHHARRGGRAAAVQAQGGAGEHFRDDALSKHSSYHVKLTPALRAVERLPTRRGGHRRARNRAAARARPPSPPEALRAGRAHAPPPAARERLARRLVI